MKEENATSRSFAPVQLAWGAHPSDVWAVRVGDRPPGEGLFRWDGTQWTLQPLQDPLRQLKLIDGSSPKDVWFTGWEGGLLYHWNGSTLERIQSGASFAINDLQVLDANTAWAVAPGGDTLKKSQLLRWDGTTWSVAADLPDNVEYLWVAGPEDVWLRAPYAVYRWHQGEFTIMLGGASTSTRAIWGSGPHDIWVARSTGLMHWNGSTMEALTDSPSAVTHIWGTGPQDVWFLGTAQTPVVHWNGSQLVPDAAQHCVQASCTWTSLQGTRPDDVWATAGGRMLHWDGKAWTVVEEGVDLNMHYSYLRHQVWRVGPGNLWTFEPSFNQVNHWDGHQLTAIPETGEERAVRRHLNDVWALSPTDVWAVGTAGMAAHYDGMRWSPVPTGTSEELLSVSGTATDDVWAVGRQGTVLHWNGQTWSQVQADTREDLLAVFAGAGGVVVAVGEKGTVMEWLTGGWHMRPGANGALTDVWARGPGDVWATNTAGTAFHWRGASVSEVALTRYGVGSLWGLGDKGLIAGWRWSLGADWWDVSATGSIWEVWVSPKGVVWLASLYARPLNRQEIVARYTQDNCWISHPILSFGFPSPPFYLRSMHGVGEHDVWLVGNYGRIFHYQLPPAP